MGVILTRVQGEPWHQRLLVAHASVNLLGWIGLTAIGTLVTLWPTMLRTRIADGAERAGRRALPMLLVAVALGAGGPLVDLHLLTAAGYLLYLVALLVLAPSFLSAARQRPPQTFPTYASAAAIGWLVCGLAALSLAVAFAGSWEEVGARFAWLAPFLVAGFATQLLLGASSYLVPVVLGGGPGPVRAANAVLDRGAVVRVTANHLRRPGARAARTPTASIRCAGDVASWSPAWRSCWSWPAPAWSWTGWTHGRWPAHPSRPGWYPPDTPRSSG